MVDNWDMSLAGLMALLLVDEKGSWSVVLMVDSLVELLVDLKVLLMAD
jgi:hypothetical protein